MSKDDYESYTPGKDEVRFNDMEKTSREELLRRQIICFQGVEETRISFRDLLGNLADFGDVIDPSTLVKLVRGDKITVGNVLSTLGDTEDFYIARTFNQQVFLHKSILRYHEESDVFATSGVEKSEHKVLAMDPYDIRTFSEIGQRKPSSYRFITLSLESQVAADQFRAVCENYSGDKYNVHWVERTSKKLIWRRSQGHIGNLIAYRESSENNTDDHQVDKTTAKCPDEDQLVDEDEGGRVVIISGTSGMGKNTVFNHLAKMMRNVSGTWVIRVDLNEFTGELHEQIERRKTDCEPENGSVDERAIEFFVEKLSKLKTDLEKRILKTMIKNCGRIALLFNGFDEIRPKYRDIVIEVLQAFKNSTGVKKLFVSCRPHTSEALEKQLGVFSYSMEPFSEENQTEFLIKFWTKRLGLNEVEEGTKKRLKIYAEAVISKVAKSIDAHVKKFIGVPLQTRMLAEIFESRYHYRDREQRDFKTCREFLGSENNEPRLPEISNMINLYDRFVNLKSDIYVEEKMKKVQEHQDVKESVEYYKQKFNKEHEVLALHTLFKAEDLKTLGADLRIVESMNKCEMDERNNGEEPSGFIIRIIDGEPQFAHRSYAEYFAANFLIRKLLVTHVPHVPHNSEVSKLILDILFESHYNIVRAFLNGLLLKNYSSPTDQRYGDNPFADGSFKSAIAKTQDMNRGNILHVTLNERNTGILKYVLNQLSELDETWNHLITSSCRFNNFSCPQTPMTLAVTRGYCDELKMLLEHDGAHGKDFDAKHNTLLHDIAGRGDSEMAEWLVQKGTDLHAIDKDNKTPLHHAAHSGNLRMVQWLVQNGADLHAIDKEDKTLLHYAAYRGNLAIVQWLVQKGADLQAIDTYDETPLHHAAYGGNLEMVQWLVEKGADLHAIDMDNKTPLHHAACEGNLEMIQCLVQKGADLHAIDTDDKTPLHHAASEGKLETARWLVQKGADLHAVDTYNETPLHHAACGGNLEIVQCLVQNGADLHAVDIGDQTPLHHAASAGNLEIVQWLVQKGADLHAVDTDNGTALHHAASGDDLGMVQWLVQNGADLHAIDPGSKTPLHNAASIGNLEMVQWLVQKGANLHAVDTNRKTPLHYAVSTGNLEMVQWLVQKGADLHAIDTDNGTPLHYAASSFRDNSEMVQWLVQKGADLHAIDKDNKTPLHHAACRGNFEMVQWLVQKGADLNAIDTDNKAPLHYAACRGNLEIVQWLVQRGANLHAIDTHNRTPLHLAAYGNLKVVQWLVKKGADLRAVDMDNKTPLHYAAFRGNSEMVQWLVQNGADTNALDRDNKTPMQCAASSGHSDLVQWFLQKGDNSSSMAIDEDRSSAK